MKQYLELWRRSTWPPKTKSMGYFKVGVVVFMTTLVPTRLLFLLSPSHTNTNTTKQTWSSTTVFITIRISFNGRSKKGKKSIMFDFFFFFKFFYFIHCSPVFQFLDEASGFSRSTFLFEVFEKFDWTFWPQEAVHFLFCGGGVERKHAAAVYKAQFHCCLWSGYLLVQWLLCWNGACFQCRS